MGDPLSSQLTALANHYLSLYLFDTASFYASLLLSHTGPTRSTLELVGKVKAATGDWRGVAECGVGGYIRGLALMKLGKFKDSIAVLSSLPPTGATMSLIASCHRQAGDLRLSLQFGAKARELDAFIWEEHEMEDAAVEEQHDPAADKRSTNSLFYGMPRNWENSASGSGSGSTLEGKQ